MKKAVLMTLVLLMVLLSPVQVMASSGEVLGMHILHPYELDDVEILLGSGDSDEWRYITIPLTLNDVGKQKEWQAFFDKAKEKRVVPLVRLASRSENGMWTRPTREEVVQLLDFTNTLQWPTPQRHIIVFNEVNHAKEWGGLIDPVEYSQVLRFVSTWAKAQHNNFIVLPAAMDLAAPNGRQTMEAFTYLNKMAEADPDIFATIDYWNSHSYPNPGFSSSPERNGQNSLRGFEFELAYLKKKTNKDYLVFITETGWAVTPTTAKRLESYYDYALKNIWSDSRIIAVTPFLMRGDPGPFSVFTFLDANNEPTIQYVALQKALEKARAASPSAVVNF